MCQTTLQSSSDIPFIDSSHPDESDPTHNVHSIHMNGGKACSLLPASFWTSVWKFYNDFEILILFGLAVMVAKVYPPLGAIYMHPKITATWLAVVFIFVVAGLGLDTHEFASAVKEIYFTLFLQGFNFGFVSFVVWATTRVLVSEQWLDRHFADGMVICSCLPMAINMVFILTKTAGGDEAAAILNSSFANLIGIFISPLLILKYLGVSTNSAGMTTTTKTGDVVIVENENVIDLRQVFSDLALRIVLPLLVGQWLQQMSPRLVRWMKDHSTLVKKSQIYALVFIVYTVFCTTFAHGYHFPMTSFILVVVYQLLLLCFVMLVSWYTLPLVVPGHKPSLRVMGFFGCTFKTVSVGVPLIQAMYSGQPQAGLYTLPVLIWHPLQLIVGSILAPYLHKYVTENEEILRKAVYEPEVSLHALTLPNEQSPLISTSSSGGNEYV